MNSRGEFVEIQSTAEGKALSDDQLGQLLQLCRAGSEALMRAQRAALGEESES
jgi:ribonuclease PH